MTRTTPPLIPEPARTRLQAPLSDADRATAVAAFAALGRRLAGDRPDVLVDYIEQALDPAARRYAMLGLTRAQADELRQDETVVLAKFAKLAKAAGDVLAALPPPRGTAAFDIAAAGKPWLRRVSPAATALDAAQMRKGPNARIPARALLPLLEQLARLAPQPARGGPYDGGPAAGLVRAVCLYRHRHVGLSFSTQWRSETKNPALQSHTDAPGPPSTTDTNELIVQAARIFGLSVTNAALRTHLLNYSSDLKALGRRAPLGTDLDGPWFEKNPTRAQANKRKKGQ